MDRIKKLKIKKQDGTFSDYIPIGADAENIDTTDGESVEIKLNKKPYYYDTVADMKADTKLKAGDMAVTLGYYSINDGGRAEYKVVSTTSQNDYQEELNNNLYATLIVKNNTINIKQLGANETAINDTNALKTFATLNVKTLIIPLGNYKINDIVDLTNKELVGIGKPNISINGITTSREHTIQIHGTFLIQNIIFNLDVARTNILGFYNSHDGIVENCTFNVNNVACNGYFDIYTNNQNIRVVNCNFNCSSLKEDGETNWAGGIWVREVYNTKETENILFENCKFYHRSKDEIIACWQTNGHLHNVQLNNCLLEASPLATSQHLLRFDCEHSSVNNCIIIYKPSDNENRASIVNAEDANYEVSFNDCFFDLDLSLSNGIARGRKITINNSYIVNNKRTQLGEGCIFKSCKFKLLELQQQVKIFLYNCVFDISQNTAWVFGAANLIINNCEFHFSASTQIDFILLFADNGTISITNTIITIPEDAVSKIRIGNFGSHTAYLQFVNNIIPSLDVGNGANMSGIIANNIYYNSIIQSSYFTYHNNFNAS